MCRCVGKFIILHDKWWEMRPMSFLRDNESAHLFRRTVIEFWTFYNYQINWQVAPSYITKRHFNLFRLFSRSVKLIAHDTPWEAAQQCLYCDMGQVVAKKSLILSWRAQLLTLRVSNPTCWQKISYCSVFKYEIFSFQTFHNYVLSFCFIERLINVNGE